jgi:hypothetical protein
MSSPPTKSWWTPWRPPPTTRQLIVEILDIVTKLQPPASPKAVRISLLLPTITQEGKHMPNFELKNTQVATVGIVARDADGDIVPAPAGDVFSAVSSDPASLGVAVNGNNTVWTPLKRAAAGITVTVSDSAGLAVDVQIVDIVADLTPKTVGLDLAGATFADQPEPAA